MMKLQVELTAFIDGGERTKVIGPFDWLRIEGDYIYGPDEDVVASRTGRIWYANGSAWDVIVISPVA